MGLCLHLNELLEGVQVFLRHKLINIRFDIWNRLNWVISYGFHSWLFSELQLSFWLLHVELLVRVIVGGFVRCRKEYWIFKAKGAFSHKRSKVIFRQSWLFLIFLSLRSLLLQRSGRLQAFLIEDRQRKGKVGYTFVAAIGWGTVGETRKVVDWWLLAWGIKLAHYECLQTHKFAASVFLQPPCLFLDVALAADWAFGVDFEGVENNIQVFRLQHGLFWGRLFFSEACRTV